MNDAQVDEAVWEDYNNSTPVGDGYRNDDGSWTQNYQREDGQIITLITYTNADGDETPRANITGATQ